MMHRIGLSRTLCPWRTHTQLLPHVSYIRSFIQASCKAQNQLSDLSEDEAVERPVKRKSKAQNVPNDIEEPTLEEKEQSIDKLHADALKSRSYPHDSESMSSELQTIPASVLSSETVSAQDSMPVMEADDQEGKPSSTNDDLTAMIPTQDNSAPTARATGPSVTSHRFKGCSYCDSSDHRLQQCPLRPSVSTLDRSPVSESPEQPIVPSASYATNSTSQKDLLEMNQRSLRLRGVVSVRRGLSQPFRQAAPSLVAGEHSSAARNGDTATWGGRVALQSVPWAGAYAGQSSSWAPAGSAVQLELEAQSPSSFQPGPLTASSATNASSQSQVCFKCGEPGHWASNCTKSYYNMRRQPFRPPAVSQLKQPAELHLSSLSPLGLPMLLEEPGKIQESPSSSMLTAQDGSTECYVHSVHDSALQCSTTALCEVSAGSGSSAPLRESAVTNVLTTAAVRTMVAVDQRSSTWLLARGDRLTASSFLMVTGISPYSNGRGCSRHDFFYEKVGIVKKLPNIAMLNGQRKEPIALQEYCLSAGGAQVASCGFVAYEPLGTWAYPADVMSDETTSLSNDLMQNNLLSSRAWLGGSPDGLVLTSEGSFEWILKVPTRS
ncbi:hypothetical protein CEUSTIGMA_g6366.t1 [Chlamydomonas eustigma]|uniref:CCHC-type domain-containing protein n=1 Tax=Chlamydomonas eustigma TaxID=1157962 RepID=A0A250X780_9CHLO|nr:hypothetical protein CEUSTIGMA_g6366.t1 [Chlamydomonas eustigma]|eukprot:GAX78927.1 hypothetical protein CEUSTIGMA_g6366.t1 [Chlamydomonas eustigma]